MSSRVWVWPVLLAVCIGCGSDRDRDGVKNAADRCPDGPRGFAVDATGCSSVEVALERGVGAMLAQREACNVGTLWALQQFLNGYLVISNAAVTSGGVAWFAHLGGFTLGILCGGLGRFLRWRRTR